jgi:hypothetical protein
VLEKDTQDTAQEDSQPISPMSSTSAADVDEILRMVPDSDPAESGIPTAIPNSPVDNQTIAHSSLFERCRQLILPLAVLNTQARDIKAEDAAKSEQLKQQVMTLMTDDYCAESMNMAKQIEEQLATKKTDVEGTDRKAEIVVGVKRPREDEDAVKSSSASRARLDSYGSESVVTDTPPPRAPKAMLKDKRGEVLDKLPPMLSPSDNVLISPMQGRNDSPKPSVSRHEISIPMEPKDFKQPLTPDQRSADHDLDRTIRDIDYRGYPSNDMDNSERRRRSHDDKSRDAEHGHRDSQYSDHDVGRSKRSRRGSDDIETRTTDYDRRDSRYPGSDLDRSDRRKRVRSDGEWDYVQYKKDSPSSSRKYSSPGSSRRHSHDHELPTTRITSPEVTTPTKTATREPSSNGSSCRVPGVWFVKVGLNHMDIVDMTFEVDAELASRCHSENGPDITVRLVSLPTASVEETYKKLDPGASYEVVTNAMRNIDTLWPPKGKIIVEVNPGDTVGKSWLPQDLVSACYRTRTRN